MAIKCEIDVEPDAIMTQMRTNGDHIEIKCSLGQTNAQNLANLINSGETLTVIVKKKNET